MSYAVEVNEARVLATRQGAGWWIAYRSQAERARRVTVVTPSIGGDLVRVACDDQEDAAWLRDHMADSGIPVTALKVVKTS